MQRLAKIINNDNTTTVKKRHMKLQSNTRSYTNTKVKLFMNTSWLHDPSGVLKNRTMLLVNAHPTYPVSLEGSCRNLICIEMTKLYTLNPGSHNIIMTMKMKQDQISSLNKILPQKQRSSMFLMLITSNGMRPVSPRSNVCFNSPSGQLYTYRCLPYRPSATC